MGGRWPGTRTRKDSPVLRSPIDPFTPAVELAAAIRRKEVSPLEVVDTCLARIDELDARLNAFCYRVDDDARKAASAAADALVAAASPEDLPPFHGVPLPIKDVLDVAGWPTTQGSAGASPAPAAASDPVVQRFVDAGFVLLGKTTTSEFGTVPFTENEALGTSRNPWDPDRTPGGSSSGAGAAVAAGMAPIAHAADGGGSIRIPASCNGLVGLKPTRGRVTNVTVDLEGLATSGVLTRSVADTAAAMDVLARHDPAAWWSPPTPSIPYSNAVTMASPTGLRIGALTDPAMTD
jgi:amidase